MAKLTARILSPILLAVGAILVIVIFYPFQQACIAPAPVTTVAMQNSSTTVQQVNGTRIAVDLQQELNNSANDGFSLNQSMFRANSSSQCSRQLISGCDNNVPSQFICVNNSFIDTVSGQRSSIYSNNSRACPDFIETGTLSCAVQAGYCVVQYGGPNSGNP